MIDGREVKRGEKNKMMGARVVEISMRDNY
jgi:hypothetical protein